MKSILLAAIIISLLAVAVWLFTGMHYYTKFQVVEQVTIEVDPDDPLAQAGFYDKKGKTETVTKDEFHLGLLPTPSSIFDKHIISVGTVLMPLWIIVLVLYFYEKRRR